jgi:hypothetical protein
MGIDMGSCRVFHRNEIVHLNEGIFPRLEREWIVITFLGSGEVLLGRMDKDYIISVAEEDIAQDNPGST